MENICTIQTALGADKRGLLSVQTDTIHTVSGDALLISIVRVPSSGEISPETSTTISRYLFGAPDGLQRALMECHVRKLGTIKGLFLVDHSSSQTGGIGGLRFALSDAGSDKLFISGPPGTCDIVDSTTAFIPREYPRLCTVDVVDTKNNIIFDDGLIDICASQSDWKYSVHRETNRSQPVDKQTVPKNICPSGHHLTSYQTPCDDCWCSKCKIITNINSSFWGCRLCDFDLCQACFLLATCPQGHSLDEYRTPCDDCWCSKCKTKVKAGTEFFGCRICDIDYCNYCYSDKCDIVKMIDKNIDINTKKRKLELNRSPYIPAEKQHDVRTSLEKHQDVRTSTIIYTVRIKLPQKTIETDPEFISVLPSIPSYVSIKEIEQAILSQKCMFTGKDKISPPPFIYYFSGHKSSQQNERTMVADMNQVTPPVVCRLSQEPTVAVPGMKNGVLERAVKDWHLNHSVAPILYPIPSSSLPLSVLSTPIVPISLFGSVSLQSSARCMIRWAASRKSRQKNIDKNSPEVVSSVEGGDHSQPTVETVSLHQEKKETKEGVETEGEVGEVVGTCSEEACRTAASALRMLLIEQKRNNKLRLQLVILGSGSARPSPHRNCSSILLFATKRERLVWSLLLDCGEGTLGQLDAHFGVQTKEDAITSDSILMSLRGIWISHKHADHHSGLSTLLERLSGLEKSHEQTRESSIIKRESCPPLPPGPPPLRVGRTLVIIASPEVLHHIQVFVTSTTHKLDRCSKNHFPMSLVLKGNIQVFMATPEEANWSSSPAHQCLIQNSQILVDHPGNSAPMTQLLATFSSIPVIHCPGAFGIVLSFNRCAFSSSSLSLIHEANRPFVLVYSGDTRPCPMLVLAGKNADVLIHEATFDDDRSQDARRKKHSTKGEALAVCTSMGVKGLLVLTHFSQRYPQSYETSKQRDEIEQISIDDDNDVIEQGKVPINDVKFSCRSEPGALIVMAQDHMVLNDLVGMCQENDNPQSKGPRDLLETELTLLGQHAIHRKALDKADALGE